MRYTITKDYAFSASHQLTGLADGHPCARLHGHNYVVTIELASDSLDERGMVLDYRRIELGSWIDANLDHTHLNDVMPGNPTAENLARWLLEVAWHAHGDVVWAVTVRETPKTSARVSTC